MLPLLFKLLIIGLTGITIAIGNGIRFVYKQVKNDMIMEEFTEDMSKRTNHRKIKEKHNKIKEEHRIKYTKSNDSDSSIELEELN